MSDINIYNYDHTEEPWEAESIAEKPAFFSAAFSKQPKPWLEKPRKQRMYSKLYLLKQKAWLDRQAAAIANKYLKGYFI